MANIALDGVSKVYPGSVEAVTDLQFEVHDGELLVLVGPSGCGKTTTLRLIAGLERPTAGTIRMGGRDVLDIAPRDRNIAMVFQQNVLYPHLSVYGNLAFGLRLRFGRSGLWSWLRDRVPAVSNQAADGRREIAERVRQAAGMLGIGGLLERRPHELSGGERQRVALGKALVQRPAAFLFDEPLSNLDASRRVQLRRELRRLHRQVSTTTLLVTHDQGEALALGDRIAVMHQGRLRQVGPPMSVYDQPLDRFVAGFVGTPPMNFWDGELWEEEGKLTFRGCGGRVELPAEFRRLPLRGAKQATLGIRPEDVALQAATERPERRVIVGRVTLVEPLGDTNLIHVEVGDPASSAARSTASLTAKASREPSWRVNDTVGIRFREQRLHVFDVATGDNLVRGGKSLSPEERD